jgi:hypothetical protein
MVARVDPGVQNGSVTIDVRLPRNLPNGVGRRRSCGVALGLIRAPGLPAPQQQCIIARPEMLIPRPLR